MSENSQCQRGRPGTYIYDNLCSHIAACTLFLETFWIIMSTNNLVIGFIDLPDEVLLTIFQKLDNIHLLFSLLGVSPKLDKIVCDITCTQSIDLSTLLPNDANDSRNNAILDRFYTRILPRIHNNVESFIVHASSLQHILRASYYSNLRKLTLVNLAIDMVPRFFNSMLFDFRSGGTNGRIILFIYFFF